MEAGVQKIAVFLIKARKHLENIRENIEKAKMEKIEQQKLLMVCFLKFPRFLCTI